MKQFKLVDACTFHTVKGFSIKPIVIESGAYMKKNCAHAAIFDMDGTFIDCEDLNRAAVEAAAGNRAIDWALLAGQPEKFIHSWIKSRYQNFSTSAEDFVADCMRGYDARKNRIRARHGMIEVVKMFQSRNMPLAVVTNTDHDPAVDKLRRAGLLDCLDVKSFKDGVLGKDDVVAMGFQPKPCADPYVVAAEILGARHITIYEDSPTGMNSATAARDVLHGRGVKVTVAHIYDYGALPDARADYVIDGRQPTDLILQTGMILDASSATARLNTALGETRGTAFTRTATA